MLVGLYSFGLVCKDPIDEMLHREQLWPLAKTKAASGQAFAIRWMDPGRLSGDAAIRNGESMG
jgi:hypothetical protein